MPGERKSHSTSPPRQVPTFRSLPGLGKAFTPRPPRTSMSCSRTSLRFSALITTPRSANYSPNGILFLTKVTLGKVRYVQKFAEVKECPPGFNSVSMFHQSNYWFRLIVSCRLSSTGWADGLTKLLSIPMTRSDLCFSSFSAEEPVS
jgi:hypothetical protein